MNKINSSLPNRRSFLLKTLTSCALCCFVTPNIFGSENDSIKQDKNSKFLSDSGMSEQDVYNFAFKQWYIPAMKNLMKQMGKKKFIEMLKRSTDMQHEVNDPGNIDFSSRTLKQWSTSFINACNDWSNRITVEVLNNSDDLFELKITECLWAKTFREAKASDIGYAGVCYQDYGVTKAFNPKMTLIRDKTLMHGDDCCHFKWKLS